MRLAGITVVGIGLFAWPFTGLGLPASTPALALALGVVLILTTIEAGTRRLDSRRLALLASIAAIDAGLRLALVVGIAGFSPIFLLILCAGYILGPTFGFLCGATALLVSAVATGGIGPWLPYQLFAAGWVGLAAGLAGCRRTGAGGRRDIAILAAVGMVTGFAYGAVMDVWDWTFFRGAPDLGWFPGMPPVEALHHFARFYLTTSLAYDSFRAVGNALMVVALGPGVLVALDRFQRRFQVVVEIDDGVVASAPSPT